VHFIGYFTVWATAKGIFRLPFWLLAMFALCASAAVVFFDAAAIVCCMRNFPTERGNTAGVPGFPCRRQLQFLRRDVCALGTLLGLF
jgi:hypothetical protein